MRGNSRWRFSFWPVLAFVVFLPCLAALGLWQVDRGFEKRDAFEQFDRESKAPLADVADPARDEVEQLPAYRRIALRGRYLGARQFLLDNMSRDGRPGHHVLAPFVPEGREYAIIVDRGWRPGLASDNRTEVGLDAGPRKITGLLAPLPRPAIQLDSEPVQGEWPRVVQFPSPAELATALDMPVASPRLLLDAAADDGFRRDWQPPGIPPARHFAYAFQWFALAAALIVIFLVMARPRRAESDES